jgi:hypothetical protein
VHLFILASIPIKEREQILVHSNREIGEKKNLVGHKSHITIDRKLPD